MELKRSELEDLESKYTSKHVIAKIAEGIEGCIMRYLL